MKKNIHCLIVVFLLMITNLVYAKTEHIEHAFVVSEGGLLHIDTDEGVVNIESWDNDEVDVSIALKGSQKYLDRFNVNIEQLGNTINISGKRSWMDGVDVRYDIKVPTQFNLEVIVGGGVIDIGTLIGDIRIDLGGGHIETQTITGDLTIDLGGGRIHAGDIVGNLTVDLGGGRIHAGDITGNLTIDLGGGSIDVGDVGGDLNIDSNVGTINLGEVKGASNIDNTIGSVVLN